jgi:hypothetical protein
VIRLSAKTHSICELSRIFEVHRHTIRKIVRSPNMRCPICRKWKPSDSGAVFRSELDAKAMFWVCRDCIKTVGV